MWDHKVTVQKQHHEKFIWETTKSHCAKKLQDTDMYEWPVLAIWHSCTVHCTREPPKGEFDWRLWATQTFLLLWSQSSLLPVQYKRKHVQYLSQSILCLKHLCTELLQYVKLEKACWSQCKKNKSWTPGKNKNSHWHSKSWTCSCLGCLKKHFFLPGSWQVSSKLLGQRLQPLVPCSRGQMPFPNLGP